MKKILRFIGNLLLAPFRLITWPFRKLRDFVTYEPDDTSTVDAFANTIENPSVLIEHIDALRKHLFRALLALAITTAISFAFAEDILGFLVRPAGGLDTVQAIDLTEGVSVFMRTSLLTGFAMSFPYIFFEFFLFINPGLRRAERIIVLTSVPVAFALFLSGMAFAYFVMLPVAVPFLKEGFVIKVDNPRASSVIQFITSVMFWIGISFQFPLVIYGLATVGIVDARTLLRSWRIAIVLIAVLAAAITPTIDPVNMALVMGPMIVLYFLSIIMARFAQRGRQRRQEALEGEGTVGD